MRLLLIRHAKTADQERGVWHGDSDVSLAPDAPAQLTALRERCQRLPIRRVLASPLARTLHTAYAVAAPSGCTVEPVDALREMRLGVFEGLSLSEMEARHPQAFGAYLADTAAVAPPGGEPFLAMQRRVLEFVFQLQATEGMVALVTHTGPILALVCAALRLDPRQRVRLHPASAGLSLLRRHAGELYLQGFNDVSHLE